LNEGSTTHDVPQQAYGFEITPAPAASKTQPHLAWFLRAQLPAE
jgi:hypothetical protein